MTHSPRRALFLALAVFIDAASILLIWAGWDDETLIVAMGVLGLVLSAGLVYQGLVTNKTLEVRADGLRVGTKLVPWDEVHVGGVDVRTVKMVEVREFTIHYERESLIVNENAYPTFDALREQLLRRGP